MALKWAAKPDQPPLKLCLPGRETSKGDRRAGRRSTPPQPLTRLEAGESVTFPRRRLTPAEQETGETHPLKD